MEQYVTPEVVVLGSVEDLTAGAGAGGAPDGEGSVEFKTLEGL
jgi:hypothetical protein